MAQIFPLVEGYSKKGKRLFFGTKAVGGCIKKEMDPGYRMDSNFNSFLAIKSIIFVGSGLCLVKRHN